MKSRMPQKLLDKAKCVIVIPSVIKGAVGFGGMYGPPLCRKRNVGMSRVGLRKCIRPLLE
jgi:lipid-binding SYLF domain-containing protein